MKQLLLEPKKFLLELIKSRKWLLIIIVFLLIGGSVLLAAPLFPDEFRTLITIALTVSVALTVDRFVTMFGIFRTARLGGYWVKPNRVEDCQIHKDAHANFNTTGDIAAVFGLFTIVLFLWLILSR